LLSRFQALGHVAADPVGHRSGERFCTRSPFSRD
jgi:hypothetical protein